ncbi:MAG: response regulator [Acidobacteriota bacterium]|nr:response regulator [Acidobacteriota bacterium]
MSSGHMSTGKPEIKKKADFNPGSTTILVVDDEPEVRKLVSAMLTRSGYKLVMSDSGDNALKIFKKYDPPIDLLLTDVVAPGMSGPMLADQLTEIQPGLRVLFMSGYDQSQVVRKYVVDRGFALLAKPFTMEQLESKVAEVLRGPQGIAAHS